eukprot:CAMPEP_0179987982 /NCGR_PEP_ID=MMETSP0984-20121128/3057_1 /TAXON_ID=483367 /ORGANISM="non described non described, Strain CCMP 2436" /LENGTH=155 /DNA_ID=CAMNT_0021906873 /DNA_START=591 /DNA_END=1055 /DNA_ORIENTATION=-
MSTYRGDGLKPPGLTSKSDFLNLSPGLSSNCFAKSEYSTLVGAAPSLSQEKILVEISGPTASLSRWMGDAVDPLISTKIFSWDKAGTASTRVEYSDFAEQFELKPGDKFEKMLDDVCMLHRLSELKTRTADSKIKEKEYSVSSKLAKLISDADLK